VNKAFVPRHFARTKRPDSCANLTDAQQYHYDVLRSVGGKLLKWDTGWWRERGPKRRERVFGLNGTAMWSLVALGLVEVIGEFTESVTFATIARGKKIKGPRYVRSGRVIKEEWSGMCPAGKHGLDYQGQACDLCPKEATVS
jgi:hypothetical protein